VKQHTISLAARLESLSPLAVLRRGYSVTQRETDGAVVLSADQLSIGDRIRTRLAAGEVLSHVDELKAATKASDLNPPPP
jgi:exodeoxyribonuclease VII large subunit